MLIYRAIRQVGRKSHQLITANMVRLPVNLMLVYGMCEFSICKLYLQFQSNNFYYNAGHYYAL